MGKRIICCREGFYMKVSQVKLAGQQRLFFSFQTSNECLVCSPDCPPECSLECTLESETCESNLSFPEKREEYCVTLFGRIRQTHVKKTDPYCYRGTLNPGKKDRKMVLTMPDRNSVQILSQSSQICPSPWSALWVFFRSTSLHVHHHGAGEFCSVSHVGNGHCVTDEEKTRENQE